MTLFSRRRLMSKERWSVIIMVFCCYSLLFACSTLQKPLIADQGKENQTIQIKASSFKFVPNNLVIYQGDIIVFSIENISDSSHNFTLEDPAGKELQNIDIPARKTINVEILFSD